MLADQLDSWLTDYLVGRCVGFVCVSGYRVIIWITVGLFVYSTIGFSFLVFIGFNSCFFSNDLLRLWPQSVHHDFQHDFPWCCKLPFLESMMTKDWVHRVVHSPVCQVLSQIVVRVVIASSPPA